MENCECRHWCRTWDLDPRALPFSNHHPNCNNYVLKTFYKIYYQGSYYIQEDAFIPDDGEEYKISEVNMTQDQFDNLKEFKGF